MQPIVVRAVEENGQSHYQLVMGERRWRAAQQGRPGDNPGDRP